MKNISNGFAPKETTNLSNLTLTLPPEWPSQDLDSSSYFWKEKHFSKDICSYKVRCINYLREFFLSLWWSSSPWVNVFSLETSIWLTCRLTNQHTQTLLRSSSSLTILPGQDGDPFTGPQTISDRANCLCWEPGLVLYRLRFFFFFFFLLEDETALALLGLWSISISRSLS